MKYIIIKCTQEDGFHYNLPMSFPNMLVHRMVFESMLDMIRQMMPKGTIEVIGSGEFDSSVFAGAVLHGESDSLQVKSRGEEDRLIFSSIDRFGMFL